MTLSLRRGLVVVFVTFLCVTPLAAQKEAPADPDAVFNVQSKIYHRTSCTSARRCTKNCVVIKLSDAKRRGGRACQICGGPATGVSTLHEPSPDVRLAHEPFPPEFVARAQ